MPGSVSQVDCTWGSAWLVLSFIHSENFMDLSFWFTGSHHRCKVESHCNIHRRSCCSNSPKVCPLAEKKTPSFHRGLPGLPDLGPHLFSELISTIPPSSSRWSVPSLEPHGIAPEDSCRLCPSHPALLEVFYVLKGRFHKPSSPVRQKPDKQPAS